MTRLLKRLPFFSSTTKNASRRGKKRLSFEQLELRRLLATITFQNANGGSWHNPANWNPQQVPGINDDAIIPAWEGNPVIQIDSTANVRTLTANEAVTVNGGTFSFTRIDQLAGSFTLNGGTLAGGTFTSGAMIVPLTGTTISGLTIAASATFRLAANATSKLANNSTLTVNGVAAFETGSVLSFENKNAGPSANGPTHILVNGSMNATGATFVPLTATQINSTLSTIIVNSGGRLSALDSTFQISDVTWDFGALMSATDLQRNRFDSELLVPGDLVRFLSQLGGGSDNRRFNRINIRGGNFNAGNLTLSAIGTETTQNLSYQLTSDLQIAIGAAIIVRANVPVTMVNFSTLTINGSAAFEAGSVLSFENKNAGPSANGPTVILVNGSMNAIGATFVTVTPTQNNSTLSRIIVNSGGRLTASDSTFQISDVTWDFGALMSATDLQRNRFDTELLVPGELVRFLSQQGGGSDNRRFNKINIRGGNFTSGTLTLSAIGTETTQNLSYQLAADLQIAIGAAIIVRANVPVTMVNFSTLTINGSATFEAGSVLSFENKNAGPSANGPTLILVNGSMNATGATFVPLTPTQINSTLSRIIVNSGGRLTASDSTFQISDVTWDFGALMSATDLQRNRFDSELLVPGELVRFLSQQGGGSDNRRFNKINIRGGNFNAGNLTLSAIGTETTQNLSYQLTSDLQIAIGAAIIVRANVPVTMVNFSTLTINGTATFEAGSVLSFENKNAGPSANGPTVILVNGSMNATGATFVPLTPTQINSTLSTIIVNSGARFNAFESSFPGIQQQHAVNSTVNMRNNNGRSVEFGTGNLSSTLTELDSFSLSGGSTALVPASVRLAPSALFSVSDSSVYSTTGSLLVEPSSPLSFVPSGTFRFVGAGTTAAPQFLEAVSNDVGLTAAGFSAANYLFGSLEVGPNTWVRVTNQADNSPGATEAIYTNSLIVRAGATLDLMNFRLYTRAVYIEAGGRVINGDVEPVFRDGGNLVLGQPTPGKVDAVAQVDEWTFFARAGGSVALRLNPGSSAQPAAVAPQLSVGRVELIDPLGRTVAFAISPSAGALASISSIVLPLEGIYKVLVSAPPSTPLATGNYVITATDTTPNPRDTAIRIQSSRTAEMLYGESVTFTASVKPLAATVPNATGTVQFKIDGVNFGTPLTLTNQVATITVPLLQAGNRQVTVEYSGDANNFDAQSSSPFTQVVNKVTLRFIAENKSKRAGEPLPAFTYLVNGFVNNETASVLSGQPSLSAPSEAINQAGVYNISIAAGTLVAANYAFEFTIARLQVAANDPAVLTAISGTPQSTKAGRRFASVMTVRVEDAYGNRIPGVSVTFASPSSGASGVFENNDRTITVTTGSLGLATVAGLLSNETVGSYAVVASVNALSLNFQMTNQEQGPPLVLTLASDSIAERGGLVVATLRRNTPLGVPLTAVLTSSNSQLVRVPLSVTFDNDSDLIQFNLTTNDNVVADGNLSVAITAASLTYSTNSSVLVIDDEEPKLNLVFSPLSVPENGGIATATISRNTPINSDMKVTFSSPDAAFIDFPSEVTILAGATSATFLVRAIDDGQVTGVRIVTLTAATPGLLQSTRELELFDNDVPALTLSFAPASVAENAGTVNATLTRNTATNVELLVNLTTDQASRMQLPPTFTIPVGQSSISFPVPLVDDSIAGGNVSAVVSATATDFIASAASLTITDNEIATLTLTSIGQAFVTEGGSSIELRVTRNTPTNVALPIALSSNKPGQLSFPAQVEIPVGASEVTFQVSGRDDQLLDGIQQVQVTASASGLQASSINIEVIDVVPLSLTLATSSISERSGSVLATVSRPNSDISQPLTVNVVSDPRFVTVDSTVTIPPNQSQVSFAVTAVDNALLDGSRTVQITTSAIGYQSASANLQITDYEQLMLSVAELTISEFGGVTIGTVRRPNSDVSQPIDINLTSSSTLQATVPASVRIEANQTQATFEITAVDNNLFDGSRTVQISAAASGYVAVTVDVQIVDFEQLSLSIVASSISELGGVAIGTVSRPNSDVSQPIDVIITSGSTTQATVPTSVRIEANQSQATFEIRAVDNDLLDGSRTVQITTQATGYQSAVADLTIDDFEQLVVTLSASTISEFGGTTVGTVRRPNSDVSQSLTVQLSSSDATEATIQNSAQQFVTILAGQSSATFPVSSVDDALLDGTQSLSLRATASGYVEGSTTLNVTDSESLVLRILPIEISERDGVAKATITRSDTGSLGELTVQITAGDSTYATFPTSVLIAAGQATGDFEIRTKDNEVFNPDRIIQFEAAAAGFATGAATLKIIDDETLQPWHNPVNNLDVNGDGSVTPSDALLVINHLSAFGSGRLSLPWTGRYIDVSGDDFIAPLDALQVINFLNRRNAGAGEGEGVGSDGSATDLAIEDATQEDDWAEFSSAFESSASDVPTDFAWALADSFVEDVRAGRRNRRN